ncbi:major histocompatibility complex class I-related gene protein-like isoform X18 [Hippocampus zosterae]|uniref:major histocompatibility complex class I-related gene protein-like isoform X18 n=1 Tax=Hippocampus zosterae TaxID=109293 RepID=UPI00223E22A3|nr:major histocompatibility complex class I-related gene protein-like isoform X18 [Hippocampus zosterae]
MSKMIVLFGLFAVAAQFQVVRPVTHSYKYFKTAYSPTPNKVDYWAVYYLDDVQILHYHSKSGTLEATQEWMNKVTLDDPHFWESARDRNKRNQEANKVILARMRERFNHTGGLHMRQRISGCDWDEEADKVYGSTHLSYDGEDYLTFDLQTLTWTAVQPQAFADKLALEQSDAYRQYKQYYHMEICPSLLQMFLRHGRDFVMRTELPVMSLLQKTPSSPITCHVTGFYPYKSALFWRKDGTELYEDVEMGETLPNHDGTFQMTAHLKAELPADAEDRYECVFQLSGVEGDMVTKLDRKLILSNERDREEEVRKMTLAVAGSVVLLVLLALLLVVLVMIYKRRQAKYMPASGDGDSELTPRPPSEPDSDASLKSVSQPAST